MAEKLSIQTNLVDKFSKDFQKSMNNANKSVESFGNKNTEAGNKMNMSFTKVLGIAGKVVGVVAAIGIAWIKGVHSIDVENRKFIQTFGKVNVRMKVFTDNLTKFYGVAQDQVLTAANAFSNEFAISATSALSIMKAGFDRGADSSGEFLDILKEYPTQFKKAGFSAKEMVAFITQTTQKGIFSDKAPDTIKEFTLRMSELPKATNDALRKIGIDGVKLNNQISRGNISMFDAMKKVSNEMLKFGDNSVEVGTILADVFGGPGEDVGLSFFKGLKDINLNLDEIPKKMSKIQVAEEQMSGAWTVFKNNIFAAEGIGTSIITGIYDGVAGALDILTAFTQMDWKKSFKSLGDGVYDSIIDSIILLKDFDWVNAFKDISIKMRDAFKKGFNSAIEQNKKFIDDIEKRSNKLKKNTSRSSEYDPVSSTVEYFNNLYNQKPGPYIANLNKKDTFGSLGTDINKTFSKNYKIVSVFDDLQKKLAKIKLDRSLAIELNRKEGNSTNPSGGVGVGGDLTGGAGGTTMGLTGKATTININIENILGKVDINNVENPDELIKTIETQVVRLLTNAASQKI